MKIMTVNGRIMSEGEVIVRLNMLESILREVQPVLGRAFFANYRDTKKADELHCKIIEMLREYN